jgi:hypothetical protein
MKALLNFSHVISSTRTRSLTMVLLAGALICGLAPAATAADDKKTTPPKKEEKSPPPPPAPPAKAAPLPAAPAENNSENDGGGGDKVTICHKGHTITVSRNALQAHLAHGDTIGSCEITPTKR